MAEFLLDREKLRAALRGLGSYGRDLDILASRGPAAAKLLAEVPPEGLKALFAALVIAIELGKEDVSIAFRSVELRRFLLWNGHSSFHGRTADWTWSDARYVLRVPVRAVSAERVPIMEISRRDPAAAAHVDGELVDLIHRARRAQRLVEENREQSLVELAGLFDCRPSHFGRLVRLNYLAPDIVTSILDGTQPTALTRRTLFEAELPLEWSLQRRLLGFRTLSRAAA